MLKANDSDRYVQPNKQRGGWDVVKEGHKRVSAHEQRKADAVKVARRIIKNQGGASFASTTSRVSSPTRTRSGDPSTGSRRHARLARLGERSPPATSNGLGRAETVRS